MNMTNVLMSYYIEVVNVMMTFCTVPLIYVLGVEPLPLPLAQFAYIAVHCCGSLMVALGSAVSCCQIVYVTNFEVLFALDPEEVCRRTFALLALLICLPNAVEAAYSTFLGIHVARDVVIFTQTEYAGPEAGDGGGSGFRFVPMYTVGWTIVFLILSSTAIIFIPLYFRYQHRNNVEGLQPQRSTSLQRYLLGSLLFFCMIVTSVVIAEQSDNRHLSQTMRILFVTLDLLLAYHLTAREVRAAATKYLFTLFNIRDIEEENMPMDILL